MTQAIDIRPYEPADRDRVLDIWETASREAHPFFTAEQRAAQRVLIGDVYLPKAETWVALWGHEIAGFIGLLDSFVGGLFVDPALHRRGIGRHLIAHALAVKGHLTLEVYARNTAALQFYRRLSFRETGRRPIDDNGLPFELIKLER